MFITLEAISHQIAAMPNELYLVRLIHSVARCSCPGERLWTANQLLQAAIVSFLRARNRQGFDIYLGLMPTAAIPATLEPAVGNQIGSKIRLPPSFRQVSARGK